MTTAKTILLVSSSVVGLGLFRVLERLGKGFRGPPRDAWLSAIAPRKTRGYAFGVHKAMDKAAEEELTAACTAFKKSFA